ncbi:MAG: type VI secretion system ImpA family N-terminal domain-containing protein [Candidatus Symbiodolus clandestinus]
MPRETGAMPKAQALLKITVPTRGWEEGLAALQEQINQSCSVNSNQSVDWTAVAQLAGDLLDQGVQHFQIIAYWGVAQLHQQGLTALVKAAERLLTLVDQSWQQALPPVNRLRGRLAAIEWWMEQSLLWLQPESQPPIEAALQDQAIQTVTALDQGLARQCHAAPSLIPLIQRLQQLTVRLESLGSESSATIEHSANPLPEGFEAMSSDLSVESTKATEYGYASGLIKQQPLPEAVTIARVVAQAQREVAQGHYQQALNQLQPCQQQLTGGERLKITCLVADCLRQAGCMELASLQIEQALSLVAQHQLESWDPPLAQQVLESAFDLFMALSKSKEASELLTRLCLLDAGRAFYKFSSSTVKEQSYGKQW